MAILPISIYPDSILLKKAKKIKDPKSQEIQELILNMLETMKSSDGLGLAAPQVGKSLRLCVISFEGKTHILINPKVSSKSWKKVTGEEGCLSFPGVFLPIKRHKRVSVKAQDRNGDKLVIKADGMLSRILQHEIDHLEGIPFIKRMAKIKKSKDNEKIQWKKAL